MSGLKIAFVSILHALLLGSASADLQIAMYNQDIACGEGSSIYLICAQVHLGSCCGRNDMSAAAIQCTGLDTTGLPEYCIAFEDPNMDGEPCSCSCNSQAGASIECVNCAAGRVYPATISGGMILQPQQQVSKRTDESQYTSCENPTEPDIGVIDGHHFKLGAGRGVPDEVTAMFYDMFRSGHATYANVPEELKAFEDKSLEALVHNTTVPKHRARSSIALGHDDLYSHNYEKRQLPPACQAS